MVIYLQRGADCLYMVQLMPLPSQTPSSLASFKSRLILPFWYRLTQVVLDKRLLIECISSSTVVVKSCCSLVEQFECTPSEVDYSKPLSYLSYYGHLCKYYDVVHLTGSITLPEEDRATEDTGNKNYKISEDWTCNSRDMLRERPNGTMWLGKDTSFYVYCITTTHTHTHTHTHNRLTAFCPGLPG